MRLSTTMRNTNRHESARMHTNGMQSISPLSSFVKIRVHSCRFVFLFLVLGLAGCDKDTIAADANALTGGDVAKGAIALRDHGCASCHTSRASRAPTRRSARR